MESTMAEAELIKVTTWQSLRLTVITAACLFVLDALVIGSVTLGIYTAVGLIVWHVPRTLFALRRPSVLRVRLLKTVIYSCMAAAIIAAFIGNGRMARTRAGIVVEAVNQFKADKNRYPESLEELVPRYMDSVPWAKFSLMFGRFSYSGDGDRGATLMYYGFPPFERRNYNFGSNKWYLID
jgi:hypothetical protein